METSMEKECSALGGLFQAIINDLKNGVPVWEDFLAKASKLHSQLKATILATTAFLDAFQRIADLATNTRGATKDIGTALTRICLRHKAVEARMKTFTSAIMECLVLPLQDKMEEWKKTVAQLDKDHAKDYKRARQEIKKRSVDTMRLQKKVRKGKCEIQRNLDTALQDVSDKFVVLEETEKHALRTALIEERSRFCLFVSYLKPVVDEEVSMLCETAHFQEIMEQLVNNTTDPFTLPVSSEQVINDIKSCEGSWSFQTPPSSPSLINSSRKSSMCSISSVNSSSSGSTKCHSPSLHMRFRSHSQQPLFVGSLRLSSVSSQDSGFTSQDTLFVRPHTPPPLELMRQMSGPAEQLSGNNTSASSNASTPSSPYGMLPAATATWPNLQETGHFDKAPCPIVGDRPHTISTAYERGHQRPPLTIHTFEPLDKLTRQVNSTPSSPHGYECTPGPSRSATIGRKHLGTIVDADQPTIPRRATTIDRPVVPDKSSKIRHTKALSQYSPAPKMVTIPDFNQPAPNQIVPQPLYVNMNEISRGSPPSNDMLLRQQSEFSETITIGLHSQHHGQQPQFNSVEGKASHYSLGSSSGYGSQGMMVGGSEDGLTTEVLYNIENLDDATKYCTIPRYANHAQFYPCMTARRPVSTAGYPNSGHYGTLQCRTGSLRRSGSQTHKPPPPVRRTSSITSQHALTVVQLRNAQSSQNIAASSYSLSSSLEMSSPQTNDISHQIIEGSLVNHGPQQTDQVRHVSQTDQFPCEPHRAPSINGKSQQEFQNSPPSVHESIPEASIVHSNTTAGTPPSVPRKSSFSAEQASALAHKPSMVGENVAINQAVLIQSLNARIAKKQLKPQMEQQQSLPQSQKDAKNLNGGHSVSSSSTSSNSSSLSDGVPVAPKMTASQPVFQESFLQSLNAKLAHHVQKNAPQSPQTTPKSQRRGSAPAETHLHASTSPLQNFRHELNAKLAQQQPNSTHQDGKLNGSRVHNNIQPRNEASGGDPNTVRVRQMMANRVPYDPVTCRESLLDQIKRGTTLRKASTNDRSAPKIQ